MPDESYMKNIMSQMMNTGPEDFDARTVDIPTDAMDGEEVAVLVTGVAKGGKLTSVQATEFDVTGNEESKKPGLKNMLSQEDEDGENEEK